MSAFEAERERVRQRRLDMGLLPDGWREPVYMEDFLVEVWRLYSVGRDDDARRLLASVWSWGMDGLATEAHVRAALQLFGRLGFVTDAPDDWNALPDPLVVYRAESGAGGYCWTVDKSVAEMHAERHGLPLVEGAAPKAVVLAYLTSYGESEVVVETRAS